MHLLVKQLMQLGPCRSLLGCAGGSRCSCRLCDARCLVDCEAQPREGTGDCSSPFREHVSLCLDGCQMDSHSLTLQGQMAQQRRLRVTVTVPLSLPLQHHCSFSHQQLVLL